MGRDQLDEFLVAIMSGIALVLYTLITFFLFRWKWKIYARWAVLIVILLLMVIHYIKKSITKKHLKKMGLDEETYLFYSKYTSLSNRISFVFTYLLQDFIYEVKKTNKSYNFSKGLFRYDDSLGEYYVDCRIAWYSYYKANLLKNRLSLNKLKIFSLGKCNKMLLAQFEDQQESYDTIRKEWEQKVNELSDGKKPKKKMLKNIEGAKELHKLIFNNLYEMEVSRKFMMDNKERYLTMIKKSDKRKDDVREIKNFYVDLNEKERDRQRGRIEDRKGIAEPLCLFLFDKKILLHSYEIKKLLEKNDWVKQ